MHAEVIELAFRAEFIRFQPLLPWISGNPEPNEQYIQPDMLFRGQDGLWRIVDFKLPLLNRKSITKGAHRRRRFVDSISEGISQLYNYHDYFSHEHNVSAAAEVLGSRVADPALTLVVGTSENVDASEVAQALRPYKPVDILDYDTLIGLYRSAPPPDPVTVV